jgi:hypothetical protein
VWLRSSDLSNTPSMMRGLRSEDQTHPDAACTNRLQPTQESSQPGSPAEDNNARRSAQPWLQVAKRSDRQQQNASSSSAANQSGCRTSAQGSGRKRGCRGHGALQKRAQQRRQKAAASQDQRDAQGRSDSNGLDSIASAMQSQSEAIMAMAQAVQQLGKQISNFLFAQRQSGQQRQQQRRDNNAGKTAELRKKGEREWKMPVIEDKANEKIAEIKDVRLAHNKSTIIQETINKEYVLVQHELNEAVQQEKEYEKCCYRRTACKAIECVIMKYNCARNSELPSSDQHWHSDSGWHNNSWVGNLYKWGEEHAVKKYRFNQYGTTSEVYKFLVDPGKFWSYDLLRSREYGERPL